MSGDSSPTYLRKTTRSITQSGQPPPSMIESGSTELMSGRASTPTSPVMRRYKAPLTTESITRTKSFVTMPPSSPTKRIAELSRPKTPASPRRESESPSFRSAGSMDVRNVDPEDVLVDYSTLEPGDESLEMDGSFSLEGGLGRQDKVQVSIRIRPTDAQVVWDTPSSSHGVLKLQPQYTKLTAAGPPEFTFDEILKGSDNKPVYNAVARSHVAAAMDGYNAVIFAYGQTASGKTFTLSGSESEPGIIPRAMKDIFSYIRRTPSREYLLRCSYLEIYNETIYDLLAPPSSAAAQPVQIQGAGNDIWLAPLREEVVTSLKDMREVIAKGESHRRTATTDWNDRSSRSHSVFRVVIESRERGDGVPSIIGRHAPGAAPPTPGGSRLQAIGSRTVRTSVLSLIDLAGSEKATSDKERTREGKYINTSLLTLGTVISTLAENAAKKKNDHVPYRNSKLTRMLAPSLSGDARISVICTINPDATAVPESTSTLLFAQRIKKVVLKAKRKEIYDANALIERYRKEIAELKVRLAEREEEAPVRNRRLSSQQQKEETKAMKDLNSRIQKLTKLILTSQTVDETQGDKSRPASPTKVDLKMSPYELQQELLVVKRELAQSEKQVLSLEAALITRPPLPPDASEIEKDRLIADQARSIRELEIKVSSYENNLGEPLLAIREDIERAWAEKLDNEVRLRQEKEAWIELLIQQIEREKRARMILEDERRALAAFVNKFDALGLGGSDSLPPSRLQGPTKTFDDSGPEEDGGVWLTSPLPLIADEQLARRLGLDHSVNDPSLLLEKSPSSDSWSSDDISFEFVEHSGTPKAVRAGRVNSKANVVGSGFSPYSPRANQDICT